MPTRQRAIFLLSASLLIILLPVVARAEPFSIPPLPEDEVKETKVYYKEGDVGLEKMVTVQRMLYLEAPSALKYHVYWVGEGASRRPEITLIEERNNETSATYTFFFRPGEHFIIESFKEMVTNKAGKEIRREHHNFTHPLLNYPDDLTHAYTIEYALRGLDFTPGTKRTFRLWLPPATILPMVARVKKVETIKLSDGSTWPCYRVEFRPDMTKFLGGILGRIIQLFVPKYTFWYDTRGTHPLIRYTGPMGKGGAMGVPTEIYDTTMIKPHPAEAQ